MGCSQSSFDNKHVLITGGSQGLGLHLAMQFAALNARVTIIARKREPLEEAEKSIKANGGTVQAISSDVTNSEKLRTSIDDACKEFGPVDVLVTCAGFAPTGYFSDLTTEQFHSAMDLNYFGTLYAVQAVLPSMKARNTGRIVLVSSALALTGYIGYSAYCPSKWAVRGLGEALRNELLPYGIIVQQAFPPNMDTPGYKIENLTKPAETRAIESGETTYTPEVVASSIIGSIKKNQYTITCGDFGIGMLARASAGMGPRNCCCTDALLLPIIVWVGKVYVWMWDKEALRGGNNNEDAAKKASEEASQYYALHATKE